MPILQGPEVQRKSRMLRGESKKKVQKKEAVVATGKGGGGRRSIGAGSGEGNQLEKSRKIKDRMARRGSRGGEKDPWLRGGGTGRPGDVNRLCPPNRDGTKLKKVPGRPGGKGWTHDQPCSKKKSAEKSP